jgi:hypothetical protein
MSLKYLLIFFAAFTFSFDFESIAEMSSTNYTITTTVLSNGGSWIESANYRMNSSIGLPSPLTDPALPPQSTNYDLLTGFWYTVGSGTGCLYDYFDDGDVDGADLEEFLNAYSSNELAAFALEFGGVDCLP